MCTENNHKHREQLLDKVLDDMTIEEMKSFIWDDLYGLYSEDTDSFDVAWRKHMGVTAKDKGLAGEIGVGHTLDQGGQTNEV